jgi:transposase
MPGKERAYTREFRLEAVRRVLEGAPASLVASELGISPTNLTRWTESFRLGGAEAVRGKGRPRRGEVVRFRRRGAPVPANALPPDGERRVAELERQLGQKQLELDFFRRALRQVETLRQANAVPGTTASTPSSRR